MGIAAVAVAAVAAGAWFARGGDEAPAEPKAQVLDDLAAAGPLTLAHFSDGTLYADGRAIPYDGPRGEVVDAGAEVLLRTQDGRIVRINKTGRVSEVGSGAAEVPVVDATSRYAVWPISPDSRVPTHTGLVIWDLTAARAVGKPAFPFPPGPDGAAPLAVDRSGRPYIVADDGQLLAWDQDRNTYVVSGVSDVDSVASSGTGVMVRSGGTTTNYPKPDPPGLGHGQPIKGTRAAWSRTGAVAWFDRSDNLLVASDGAGAGDRVGWPTDLEPGRIVWESGTAFVVLPESDKQPAIRCYVGNDDCRVVAKSKG